MNGPYEAGTFVHSHMPSELSWETRYLKRGQAYRVTKSFQDADGDEHCVGEEWEFIESLFSKFDDELTLCVRSPTNEEWKIPLIWKPEDHEDVIEGFLDYVSESGVPGPEDLRSY